MFNLGKSKMLVRTVLNLAVLTLLFLSTSITGCKSDPPPSVEKLLRVVEKNPTQNILQVINARYEHKSKSGALQTVDFIGAVHLGEETYFEQLNEVFRGYDVVLFELVGDPARVKEMKDSARPSLLGKVQRKLGDTLGLSFQLDKVDYTAKNFVHADMTPEQLADAMDARGESALQMLVKIIRLSFDPELQKELKATGYSSKEIEGINPLMVLMRGPTEKERAALKRFMAFGLMSSDKVLKALEGAAGGVLIADRNKVAVERVKEQLEKGTTKIAVYYGVGHLPDMNDRFNKELGLKLTSVWWSDAWNLPNDNLR
jgi:hypothetical protein